VCVYGQVVGGQPQKKSAVRRHATTHREMNGAVQRGRQRAVKVKWKAGWCAVWWNTLAAAPLVGAVW